MTPLLGCHLLEKFLFTPILTQFLTLLKSQAIELIRRMIDDAGSLRNGDCVEVMPVEIGFQGLRRGLRRAAPDNNQPRDDPNRRQEGDDFPGGPHESKTLLDPPSRQGKKKLVDREGLEPSTN